MKSKVFFVPVEDAENIDAVNRKLNSLLAESRVLSVAEATQKVVVKLHFGEEGTHSYVRPAHLRLICDEIAKKARPPFFQMPTRSIAANDSTRKIIMPLPWLMASQGKL